MLGTTLTDNDSEFLPLLNGAANNAKHRCFGVNCQTCRRAIDRLIDNYWEAMNNDRFHAAHGIFLAIIRKLYLIINFTVDSHFATANQPQVNIGTIIAFMIGSAAIEECLNYVFNRLRNIPNSAADTLARLFINIIAFGQLVPCFVKTNEIASALVHDPALVFFIFLASLGLASTQPPIIEVCSGLYKKLAQRWQLSTAPSLIPQERQDILAQRTRTFAGRIAATFEAMGFEQVFLATLFQLLLCETYVPSFQDGVARIGLNGTMEANLSDKIAYGCFAGSLGMPIALLLLLFWRWVTS